MKDFLFVSLCLTVAFSLLGMHPVRALFFSSSLAGAFLLAVLATADGLANSGPDVSATPKTLAALALVGVSIFIVII